MPHIMEMMGKARVVVKDGKVVEVGAPEVEWCPLFVKLRGVQKMTQEEIRKNMESRISELGMFTENRKLEFETTVVAFGASEVMMSGLNSGFLETTVTACDGAGTVISGNPALVQGIGGRMSGLVETEPIDAVIKGVEERGGTVLDPSTAVIDPASGVKKAVELGYRRIAVTIADPKTAKNLRKLENKLGLDLIIIAVHVTGLSREESQEILENSDIVISCASRYIRELAKPLVQVAAAIPLFALTQKGKELVIERAKDIQSPILINTMKLPVLPAHKQPKNLV
ncbi:putative methanogenesis marker protein 8 [Methanosarcina barkeri str. Wiesmoor]|uniref:Methanogenesis marker protein 8 n=2 Tax=Methanosarcina barkeri TaxID=2208 RepID=Q468C9_METBF|nr:methanogenesis marker 8 protein [Methanosarcina barkeri]AKB51126.1 putative methanogenesis marker protein 8 [Methanosarcina barkeri str. Wiesmoor]